MSSRELGVGGCPGLTRPGPLAAHLCHIISLPLVSALVPSEVGPTVNCADLTQATVATNATAPAQ